MAFKFRLHTEGGGDVGTFATAVPDWKVGDEFRTGDGHRFEITNQVPPARRRGRRLPWVVDGEGARAR